MNYELAKELKDAGFKQGDMFVLDDGNYVRHLDSKGCYCPRCAGWYEDTPPTLPTLSELIDACGDEFEELIKGYDLDKWIGRVLQNDGEHLRLYGKTPEEAVAKLYLALTKKV